MLANALKRMDGLIGSYSESREEGGPSSGGAIETVGSRICRLSNELRAAIAEYEGENAAARSGVDPRAILPQETTASIVHWLSAGQLQRQASLGDGRRFGACVGGRAVDLDTVPSGGCLWCEVVMGGGGQAVIAFDSRSGKGDTRRAGKGRRGGVLECVCVCVFTDHRVAASSARP